MIDSCEQNGPVTGTHFFLCQSHSKIETHEKKNNLGESHKSISCA